MKPLSRMPLSPKQRKILFIVAPVLIITTAFIVATSLLSKPTRATLRGPVEELARWVNIDIVKHHALEPIINAQGVVKAARQIDILPEVSGRIVALSSALVPGSRVVKGQVLLQIDTADYQLSVDQARAALMSAKADLSIELGQQSVAQQEYQLIGEDLPQEQRSLILRKPQLQAAQALVATAQTALEQAELNLARTSIRAPFNGIVADKFVDVGSRATSNTALLTLLASDEFWVHASVDPAQLRWIDIPGNKQSKASQVTIFNSAGQQREASILRLLPNLSQQTRQAELLIRLPDPLALEAENSAQAPVMANAFVAVNIHGRVNQDLIELPRVSIRDGDTVWLMDDDNRLHIQSVNIVYRGSDSVYIDGGVTQGQRVVTSLLKTPISGTLLKAVKVDGIAVDLAEAEPASSDEVEH